MSGLTAAAKALLRRLRPRRRVRNGVVLYVVPSDADIEQAVADVALLSCRRSKACPTAAVERAVLPFPSHEVDPYRGLAPHVGVTSARARALHALATGTARSRHASAAALLPRVSAPARLLARRSSFKPGQDIAPTDLAELLVDAGFTREDPADEHGEFAVRGGIVDIFPAGEAQPVRLEFIGDTIEIAAPLRSGDAALDRADRSAGDRAAARRARRRSTARRSSTTWRARKMLAIVVSERDEVEAHGAKLLEQLQQQLRRSSPTADGQRAARRRPTALFADWIDRVTLASSPAQR